MTDPSLNNNLTPAKRVECEVMTHPDEPPKRLHQSLPKDDGSESESDYDWDSCPDPACDPGWGKFFDFTPVKVGEGEKEKDEDQRKLPDEVKNSEDYKKYLQLITETEGYDCGSFDFPCFDFIITQAPQRHIDRNSVYVEPALQDYNKQHNRNLVFDSIEKMNIQFAVCCYEKYYVSFKVKDMDDGAALKTFQCSFMVFVAGPSFEQFREKPTQP